MSRHICTHSARYVSSCSSLSFLIKGDADCAFNLSRTTQYDWLWKASKDSAYAEFASSNPSLKDYDIKLRHFGNVGDEIDRINSTNVIGVLSLQTAYVKKHLRTECQRWKVQVS